MKTKLSGLKTVLVLTVLSISAAPGVSAQNQSIAEVENLGRALVFHPFVEFERLILTVTGSCGFEYRQVVTRDETPVFELDRTVIDGPYTYNLMREETVDPSIVKILREARANFDQETPKALCRDGKLPPAPTAQSEGFLVQRGKIIYDPDSIEKRNKGADFTKDFVINDDLIVDGSACIGFDCVNGESFGFDTLRLKENNLRIKFQDTSVAASYPRNVWQLTANDSANGGAEKFSIDDISGNRTPFTVEANARSHSLYVDDGGRIGSRTSTPSVELHTIDGDTPTLRLQQDGSSGFAPQTWDVAGNETNFFIRDVTNGSALPFRIRPAAPTSSIFIDVDGDVGMRTSSPDSPLHIVKDSGAAGRDVLRLEKSGNVGVVFEDTSATAVEWSMGTANDGDFNIALTGTGVLLEVTQAGDLFVNGMMMNVPDYVFEDGYRLMPLPELAAFIEARGHLPGVTSATEVAAAGGVNIVRSQMQLLEKVEELTLYTLQQQAVIDELSRRLEAR